MTIIEKILAEHVRNDNEMLRLHSASSGSGSSSGSSSSSSNNGSESSSSSGIVKPGDIVDVVIDVRLARDFGGAGVIKHLEQYNLAVADRSKTFFTFDCNPTGSDQQYATNQQRCRHFARTHQIDVFD